MVHTIMGIEDHFLLRIGDVTKSKNFLHAATCYYDKEGNSWFRRSVPEEDVRLNLKPDRWYHVAVTFDNGYVRLYLDGKQMAEGDVAHIEQIPDPDNEGAMKWVGVPEGKFMYPHSDELQGKPRCFWIGYSYEKIAEGKMDRCLDGMIAEARVWNVVRTPEEIKDNCYKLYPDKETGKFPAELLAYWKFNEGEGKTVKDHSIYGHDLTGFNNFIWYPVDLPLKN